MTKICVALELAMALFCFEAKGGTGELWLIENMLKGTGILCCSQMGRLF